MKKIVIFEIEHFETAFALIRLFDLPGNTLTVYTDEKTASRLLEYFGEDAKKHTWVLQQKEESHRAYVRRMFTAFKTNKPALLIYSTLSHNHLVHALLIRRVAPLRVILTVHAINSLFHYPIRFGVRSIARYVGIKLLLKQIHEFNVVSDTMIDYLKNCIKPNNIIHNIPAAVFEHNAVKITMSAPVRLVIPGSIDNTRRDYLQVFDLLDAADKMGFPVHAILLGAPFGNYGKKIIDMATNRVGRTTTMKCFDSIVSLPVFDEYMASSQFVWIPSSIDSEYEGVREVYGITKSSGNIFDVIRHSRPFIIPEKLVIPMSMEKSAFRYATTNDIIAFLQGMNTDQYEEWQSRAIETSEYYTAENIRARNIGLYHLL